MSCELIEVLQHTEWLDFKPSFVRRNRGLNWYQRRRRWRLPLICRRQSNTATKRLTKHCSLQSRPIRWLVVRTWRLSETLMKWYSVQVFRELVQLNSGTGRRPFAASIKGMIVGRETGRGQLVSRATADDVLYCADRLDIFSVRLIVTTLLCLEEALYTRPTVEARGVCRMRVVRLNGERSIGDSRLWCILAENRASFIDECHISTFGLSLLVHTSVIPASVCPAYHWTTMYVSAVGCLLMSAVSLPLRNRPHFVPTICQCNRLLASLVESDYCWLLSHSVSAETRKPKNRIRRYARAVNEYSPIYDIGLSLSNIS